MATYCSICHDRLFRFRCRQCRKPVCEECAFSTQHGRFCSRRCAARFRDFKSHKVEDEAAAGGPSLLRALLVLIVLGAVVLVVGAWQGWLPESVQSAVRAVGGRAAELVGWGSAEEAPTGGGAPQE